MRYAFLLVVLVLATAVMAATPVKKGASQPLYQTVSGASFGGATGIFTAVGCEAPTEDLWNWISNMIVGTYIAGLIVTFVASAMTGQNGAILGDAVVAGLDFILITELCSGFPRAAMTVAIFLPGAIANHAIRSHL